MYRQGDVLLKEVKEIKGKKTTTKRKVLAEGEATGHYHELVGDDVEFFDDNGRVLLQIQTKAELTHQEHENITLPKGKYEVIIQREYDLQEGVRQVMD